jgi:hypothetical protein
MTLYFETKGVLNSMRLLSTGTWPDGIGLIWSFISKVYLGSKCTVLIYGDPATTPPPAFGLAQDRRHLFVTPCPIVYYLKCGN